MLTERVAGSVQDFWPVTRLSEGWTYRPDWRGGIQQIPVLIPAVELSETEKRYDRDLAIETLKDLPVLGYSLVPPEPDEERSE